MFSFLASKVFAILTINLIAKTAFYVPDSNAFANCFIITLLHLFLNSCEDIYLKALISCLTTGEEMSAFYDDVKIAGIIF